jgi:lysozyme
MESDKAIELASVLCRKFEGLRLTPYLCPKGIPTIGYGSTMYENGRKVSLSDSPITTNRAEHLMRIVLWRDILPAVLVLCPKLQGYNKIAAIVDFSYNLGIGRLRTSTLRRKINDERWSDVNNELRKWVLSGGKKLPGLVARREAEIAIMGNTERL